MLQMPAGRKASGDSGSVEYERHRPERTLLYQLVEEYYPAFEAQWAAEGKALPGYVQREFADYRQCGRLEHGFLRVRCGTCHAERLVAIKNNQESGYSKRKFFRMSQVGSWPVDCPHASFPDRLLWAKPGRWLIRPVSLQ